MTGFLRNSSHLVAFFPSLQTNNLVLTKYVSSKFSIYYIIHESRTNVDSAGHAILWTVVKGTAF